MEVQDTRGTMLLTLFAFLFCLDVTAAQRIAIIGEGIGGSFAAKYLTEYDTSCQLEEITIFEAVPLQGPISSQNESDGDFQGSRVTSLQLKDGTNIELGASIAYKGFSSVVEMVREDPEVETAPPFSTGLEDEDLERNMGLYLGDKQWAFRTFSNWKFLNKFMLMFRYGHDLLRMSQLKDHVEGAFVERLPGLLASNHAGTFFQHPEEIWGTLGVLGVAKTSFSAVLESAGIVEDVPYWRTFLPFQGSLRKELLTAINLVNYNQDNDDVNGVVGCGSFSASAGGLFSIKGGNHALVRSAVRQGSKILEERQCPGKIIEKAKRVTHVVADMDRFSLISVDESLGEFDFVILATPLQHARIDFSVQSQFDDAVLQPMPLGGLIDTENDPPENHEGHDTVPGFLPDALKRPYTQVVTTILSSGRLQGEILGLGPGETPPTSILFTNSGKQSLHNITAITRIRDSGIYKLFSSSVLSEDVKKTLFGPNVVTEHVKVWGGPHGGATPAYQGKCETTGFLLYDGATGIEGHTTSGGLYYPSAFEHCTLSSMEISAVGAKAVSKLIARRLGWVEEISIEDQHDEL